MPKVTFLPDGKTVEVPRGMSILDAATKNGIFIEHACGGFCACTTCHVIVPEGLDRLSEMADAEMDRLDFAEHVTLESRLACQARVKGDVTVRIPDATTFGGAHLSREERAERSH